MKTEALAIKSIATATIGSIPSQASVKEALLQMKLQHVRFLLVTNENSNFFGLLRAGELAQMHLPPETRVSAVARPIGFLSASEDLKVAAEILLEKNLGGLVLLDDSQHVVGVVTADEFLRFLGQLLNRESTKGHQLLGVASLQSLGEIANELSLLGI